MRLLCASLVLVLAASCAAPERERRRSSSRMADAANDGDKEEDKDTKETPRRTLDPARSMVLHQLDVGQGAALLIELPCGVILIDTGGEQNSAWDGVAALKTQLDAFFARRTDLNRTIGLLIISHPHIDHVRGVPTLLESFTVKNVVDDGKDGAEEVATQIAALRRYVTDKRIGYRGVKNLDITKKNGLTDEVIDPFVCAEVDPQVRILSAAFETDPGWGTDNYGKAHFDDMNNHSVVVRVDVGNASVLVSGDLEEVAIKNLLKRYRDTRWLDVDVWQVGHHGSHNGITRDLVLALSPMVALIPSGPASRHEDWTAWAYGHPRAVVVDLLLDQVSLPRSPLPVPIARGVKKFETRIIDRAIYCTGWDGPITVELGADGTVQVAPPTAPHLADEH